MILIDASKNANTWQPSFAPTHSSKRVNLILCMVEDRNRTCRACHLGVELLLPVHRTDQPRYLSEAVFEHLRHILTFPRICGYFLGIDIFSTKKEQFKQLFSRAHCATERSLDCG